MSVLKAFRSSKGKVFVKRFKSPSSARRAQLGWQAAGGSMASGKRISKLTRSGYKPKSRGKR